MHYRNGRPAQNGDRVIQFEMNTAKAVAVGTLVDAVPGNDYCNGYVEATDHLTGAKVRSVACLCDCLHVEDLDGILQFHELDKRPEGK